MPYVPALKELLSRIGNRYQWVFLLVSALFLLWSVPVVIKFSTPGINFYLALMALPFCMMVQQRETKSIRYGMLALLFALAYYLLQVQTFYFLSFCAALLFIVEQLWGKVSRLPLFLMLTVSPIVHYLVHISSFPIRLQISQFCAYILSFVIDGTYAQGNVIYTHDEPFEVEAACLGLGTVITGAIIGYAILGYHEFKKKVATRFWRFLLWGLLLLVLLIGSNLFRIMALVFFKIPPSNVMHDLVGLGSLALYALLPLWFVTPWFVKGASFHSQKYSYRSLKHLPSVVGLAVFTLLCWGQVQYNNRPVPTHTTSSGIPTAIAGFKRSEPNVDVTKFSNQENIVYYKPCKSFYHGTHSAAGCWQGSGFQIKQERVSTVNHIPIMTALLEKDSIQLHTAWWYENAEKKRVIGELNWRIDMMKTGIPYTIVNVSSVSEEGLMTLLKEHFLPETANMSSKEGF